MKSTLQKKKIEELPKRTPKSKNTTSLESQKMNENDNTTKEHPENDEDEIEEAPRDEKEQQQQQQQVNVDLSNLLEQIQLLVRESIESFSQELRTSQQNMQNEIQTMKQNILPNNNSSIIQTNNPALVVNSLPNNTNNSSINVQNDLNNVENNRENTSLSRRGTNNTTAQQQTYTQPEDSPETQTNLRSRTAAGLGLEVHMHEVTNNSRIPYNYYNRVGNNNRQDEERERAENPFNGRYREYIEDHQEDISVNGDLNLNLRSTRDLLRRDSAYHRISNFQPEGRYDKLIVESSEHLKIIWEERALDGFLNFLEKIEKFEMHRDQMIKSLFTHFSEPIQNLVAEKLFARKTKYYTRSDICKASNKDLYDAIQDIFAPNDLGHFISQLEFSCKKYAVKQSGLFYTNTHSKLYGLSKIPRKV